VNVITKLSQIRLNTTAEDGLSCAKISRRLLDIDRAKGLAVIFVVIGHVSDTGPTGNKWYDTVKGLIYSFHMAYFMFLSGYVMYISYHPLNSINKAATYVWHRFVRLMVPFFFFCLLIFWGKYVAKWLVVVNNPVESLSDFLTLILYPTDSIAGSLWYIYVLFLFSISFPFLMMISRGIIEYWIPLGIILSFTGSFVSISHLLAFYQICAFFIFILAGAIAAKRKVQYLAHIDKWGWAWVCFFVTSLFIKYHVSIPLIVTGMLSVPALHALIRKNPLAKSDLLLTLGTFVFSIYLMNTIFMGSIRGLILRFVSLDYWHFLIICPILIIVGLLCPVLVYSALGHRSRIFSMLLGAPR
jgi:fucose 4-O-acetylase-like acetyltransferase